MAFAGVADENLVEPRHLPDQIRDGRLDHDGKMVLFLWKGPPKRLEKRNLVYGVSKPVVRDDEYLPLAGGGGVADEELSHPDGGQNAREQRPGEKKE